MGIHMQTLLYSVLLMQARAKRDRDLLMKFARDRIYCNDLLMDVISCCIFNEFKLQMTRLQQLKQEKQNKNKKGNTKSSAIVVVIVEETNLTQRKRKTRTQ